jgi:hypothetical protein
MDRAFATDWDNRFYDFTKPSTAVELSILDEFATCA